MEGVDLFTGRYFVGKWQLFSGIVLVVCLLLNSRLQLFSQILYIFLINYLFQFTAPFLGKIDRFPFSNVLFRSIWRSIPLIIILIMFNWNNQVIKLESDTYKLIIMSSIFLSGVQYFLFRKYLKLNKKVEFLNLSPNYELAWYGASIVDLITAVFLEEAMRFQLLITLESIENSIVSIVISAIFFEFIHMSSRYYNVNYKDILFRCCISLCEFILFTKTQNLMSMLIIHYLVDLNRLHYILNLFIVKRGKKWKIFMN